MFKSIVEQPVAIAIITQQFSKRTTDCGDVVHGKGFSWKLSLNSSANSSSSPISLMIPSVTNSRCVKVPIGWKKSHIFFKGSIDRCWDCFGMMQSIVSFPLRQPRIVSSGIRSIVQVLTSSRHHSVQCIRQCLLIDMLVEFLNEIRDVVFVETTQRLRIAQCVHAVFGEML